MATATRRSLQLVICAALWSATAAAVTEEHVVVHVQARAGTAPAPLLADGSRSSPFPSIEAARDHLRALRTSSSRHRYRVVVGAGTYPPLQLGPQDSGTHGSPVIYEADRSEGPVNHKLQIKMIHENGATAGFEMCFCSHTPKDKALFHEPTVSVPPLLDVGSW